MWPEMRKVLCLEATVRHSNNKISIIYLLQDLLKVSTIFIRTTGAPSVITSDLYITMFIVHPLGQLQINTLDKALGDKVDYLFCNDTLSSYLTRSNYLPELIRNLILDHSL